jgi:hypothetical protein
VEIEQEVSLSAPVDELDPDDPAPHPNVVADISDPDDMEAPTPTQVKYCFLKLTTTLILSNAVELNVLIRIPLYCVFFQIITNFFFFSNHLIL